MTEEKRADVYDVYDLMRLLGCKRTVATRIKREIKAVSDITHNNRVVHKIDYEIWCKVQTARALVHNGIFDKN